MNAVGALEALQFPAYVVDCQRRVRWQNPASIELLGDLRGRLDTSAGLDQHDLARARAAFEQKVDGAPHTELEVSVRRSDGTGVRVAVSSVPLKDCDGAMIGSFGVVQVLGDVDPRSDRAPSLSARQHEVLELLAAGRSTGEMAQQLDISPETVRNHVKRVLGAVGASSRVEAVAKARGLGLI